MYQTEITIRVRYAETDQMGFVYYGKYAEYLEVARVECLRSLGLRYRDLEAQGIWLPVVDYAIRFIRPANYDDELLIRTTIKDLPAARISFDYECRNREDQLICSASTDLFFLDADSRKPMKCPLILRKALEPHFQISR